MAHLRFARSSALDEIFDIASLDETLGAQYKGLKQGASEDDVIRALGKPDATIHYQRGAHRKLCYFKDRIDISFEGATAVSFHFGKNDASEVEVKENGPVLTRY